VSFTGTFDNLLRLTSAIEDSGTSLRISGLEFKTRTPHVDDYIAELIMDNPLPENARSPITPYGRVLQEVADLCPPANNILWMTTIGSTREGTWELAGGTQNQADLYQMVDRLHAQKQFLTPRINSLIWDPQARQWSFRLTYGYQAN
jgi:hypothetical protein